MKWPGEIPAIFVGMEIAPQVGPAFAERRKRETTPQPIAKAAASSRAGLEHDALELDRFAVSAKH
jgi:hypothetical protein